MRRREGLRLLTVEIPEPVIEAAIARGLLKPEDCTQSSSVMRDAFAAQLSDTALNWLTSNRNGVTGYALRGIARRGMPRVGPLR